MALIGTLNSAVAGNVIDPDEYNANMDAIRNAFNDSAVLTDVAKTVTVQHTFNPAATNAPFILGANAQGQLVSGLNADKLDGQEGSYYLDVGNFTAGTFASGNYSFPEDLSVSGLLTISRSVTPFLRLTRSDIVDKSWDFRVNDITGDLQLRAVADVGTTVAHMLNVTHNGTFLFKPSGNDLMTLDDGGGTQLLLLENDVRLSWKDALSGGAARWVLYLGTDDVVRLRNPVGDIYMMPSGNLRATFSNTLPLKLHGTTGELLRLDDSSATGDPQLSFYQAGTERARIRYTDSISGLQFRNTEAGLYRFDKSTGARLAQLDESAPHFQIQGASDEHLRLDHTSATGSPYLSFYQAGSRVAFIQFIDSGGVFRIQNDQAGWIQVRSSGDHVFSIEHTSATGSPYLSFYQSTTLAAYIQYVDSGDVLLFRAAYAGGSFEWHPAANSGLAMTLDTSGDLTVAGTIFANGGDEVPTVLRATDSTNPPNIVAGSFHKFTVTVTGAVAGDIVVVNNPTLQNADENLIFYGFVSAANTVTVVIVNTDSVDRNPGTGTTYITVIPQ